MKKYSCILLLLILAATSGRLTAQCPGSAATPFDPARGGILTTSGALIFSEPGSQYVQDGGMDDADGGTLEINGDVSINGDLRLSNNSSIVINTGGRLFVYGNMYVNNGSSLMINTGANLYFYGTEWINESGAVISNSGGAGTISFIMPRPAVGAADPVSGVVRYPDNSTAYTSVADAIQYLDGGGVDMNVNMAHYNVNNISLCNLDNSVAAGSGDTRLSGTVTFLVTEGDVILNNNNFILTATGNYAHNAVNIYDGYFVTNGTGMLRKEGLAGAASFVFPVGQAESDYTPATVTNTTGSAVDYNVQVKTYANSASLESVPAEGMNRTWQIHGSTAGTANICLQHNSVTNAAGPGTDGGSFNNTMAFATQQIGSGVWSPGTQMDGGSPTSVHCADFPMAATAAATSSYFTKSSDPLTPLPVTLASFEGSIINCAARLRWKTSAELSSSKYIIQHSTNSIDYIIVGELPSQNNVNGASYEYNYPALNNGSNYFRLQMVDKDNRHTYSPVVSLISNCKANIVIAPNPVRDILTIRGLTACSRITVFNAAGQRMESIAVFDSYLRIDAKKWNPGLYMITVTENGKLIKTEKLVKR